MIFVTVVNLKKYVKTCILSFMFLNPLINSKIEKKNIYLREVLKCLRSFKFYQVRHTAQKFIIQRFYKVTSKHNEMAFVRNY